MFLTVHLNGKIIYRKKYYYYYYYVHIYILKFEAQSIKQFP